jgi:hypothetical protein
MLIRQQGRGTFVASHNRTARCSIFHVPQAGAKEYPVVRLLAFAKPRPTSSPARRCNRHRRSDIQNPESAVASGELVIVDTSNFGRFPGWPNARSATDPAPCTTSIRMHSAFPLCGLERLRATIVDRELAAPLSVPGGCLLLEIDVSHSPMATFRRIAHLAREYGAP